MSVDDIRQVVQKYFKLDEISSIKEMGNRIIISITSETSSEKELILKDELSKIFQDKKDQLI